MISLFLNVALSTVVCVHTPMEAERAFLKYAELTGPTNAKYQINVNEVGCEYFGIVWLLPLTPDMNNMMKLDVQGRIYVHGRNGWKAVENQEWFLKSTEMKGS